MRHADSVVMVYFLEIFQIACITSPILKSILSNLSAIRFRLMAIEVKVASRSHMDISGSRRCIVARYASTRRPAAFPSSDMIYFLTLKWSKMQRKVIIQGRITIRRIRRESRRSFIWNDPKLFWIDRLREGLDLGRLLLLELIL